MQRPIFGFGRFCFPGCWLETSRWRYPIVLFLIGFALSSRWWLNLNGNYPFVSFLPVILFSAIFLGYGASLLATALCFILAWYIVVPPAFSFIVSVHDFVPFAITALFALAMVYLVQLVRRFWTTANEEKTRVDGLLIERGLLYKELQHRVANNMMFISGMLARQKKMMLANPKEIETLTREAISRISHMGKLHRRFSDVTDEGNLEHKVREFCQDFQQMIGHIDMEFKLEIEEMGLSSSQFSIVAMLLHEIVSNSVKHAFRDRTKGTVTISAIRRDDDVVFCISDDGPGVEVEESSGLGSQIIEGLCHQLRANITPPARGSSLYEIRFPVLEPSLVY